MRAQGLQEQRFGADSPREFPHIGRMKWVQVALCVLIFIAGTVLSSIEFKYAAERKSLWHFIGGNLIGIALNASGLHLPPPPGLSTEMAFRVLHVPALMIGSSVMVVVSLALASILPAVRASRLQIAEALAHV